MFKLLLGRAGAGKTTAVLNRLCEASRERPQVLLVPLPARLTQPVQYGGGLARPRPA